MRFKRIYDNHLLGHYTRVYSKPRGPYMTQRKKEERRHARQIAFCSFFLGFLLTIIYQGGQAKAMPSTVTSYGADVTPIVVRAGSTTKTVEGITPTPITNPIEKEIKEVFGKHYPKAMLLLKGDGKPGACAENRGLDPKAINDNTKWGGVGIDYGVFQINNHWQGVSNVKFLKDPHINIRIAWRIFEDSGYSFKLWTCGKVYGI